MCAKYSGEPGQSVNEYHVFAVPQGQSCQRCLQGLEGFCQLLTQLVDQLARVNAHTRALRLRRCE